MPRDGQGNMVVPFPDFVSGTSISSDQVDANNADLAAELSNSLPRDGQAPPTADIPFGNKRILQLGRAAASTDAITAAQVREDAMCWCGATSGVVDGNSRCTSYSATAPLPPFPGLVQGARMRVVFHAENGTAPTLNLSGSGAKPISHYRRGVLTAVPLGFIRPNSVAELVYAGNPQAPGINDAWVLLAGDSYQPAWVEIAEAISVSGAPSVSFALPGGFPQYRLEWLDVRPLAQSGSGAPLFMRGSTNGGLSYRSGAADYTFVFNYQTIAAAAAQKFSATTGYMQISAGITSNGTANGFFQFTPQTLYGFGSGVTFTTNDNLTTYSVAAFAAFGPSTHITLGIFNDNLATYRFRLMGMIGP